MQMYMGHVSFIYHIWCFYTANCIASVLQCLNMSLNIMLENENRLWRVCFRSFSSKRKMKIK